MTSSRGTEFDMILEPHTQQARDLSCKLEEEGACTSPGFQRPALMRWLGHMAGHQYVQ